MSFLDDTKNFGIVATIVAIVMVISAILTIVDDNIWIGIGSLIYAVLLFVLGYGIYKDKVLIHIGSIFSDLGSKFGVLTAYVAVVGLGSIVVGIFGIIGGEAGSYALNIVIGIIALIFVYIMKDGQQTTLDKIIWIILLVIFVLGLLGGIILLIAFPIGTLLGIAYIIMYLCLLTYLFSGEVKSKLGM